MRFKSILVLMLLLVSSFAGVIPAHADPPYYGNKTGANTSGTSSTGGPKMFAIYVNSTVYASTTTLYFYIQEYNGFGSGNIKGCIWAADLTLLATSSTTYNVPGTVGVTHWVSVTIAYDIQPGTNYFIGFVTDATTGAFALRSTLAEANLGYIDTTAVSYAAPTAFSINTITSRYLMYVEYEEYVAPTIVSTTVNNFDDTDNIYIMKKSITSAYTFRTIVNDVNGPTEIANVSVRGMQGVDVRWMVNVTDVGTGAPSVTTTGYVYVGSWSCSNYNATARLVSVEVRFLWGSTAEDDCDLAAWAVDSAGLDTGWVTTQTDYYDVIGRLLTTGPIPSSDTVVESQNVTISGELRYALTQTSNATSTVKPRTDAITSISVWDQFGAVWGSTVPTDGVYSITFNTTGATSPFYFYIYVNRASPGADELTPDGRYAWVQIIAFVGGTIFGVIGSLLGISDITAPVIAAVTDLIGSFTLAIGTAVDLVIQVFRMITMFAGSVVYWFTNMITWFITIYNAVDTIFTTAAAVSAPYAELIALLFSPEMLLFAAVIGFAAWYGSLSVRAKRTGQGMAAIITGDVQVIMYWVDLMFGWTMALFNLVWGIVTWFAGLIAGALT